MSENNEMKYVTYEMFEQYHNKLMEYIGMHDDLMLEGFTTCPKCGATITSDKCDKCNTENTKMCPKCGNEIGYVIISTNPYVVAQEKCTNCDWLGEYEEVKLKL